MTRTNKIKLIIIIALILGELAVWMFPYENPGNINTTKIFSSIIKTFDKATEVENDRIEEEPETKEEVLNAENTEILDDPKSKPALLKDGILILVNKINFLDAEYKPDDLSPIYYYAKDRSSESRYMRTEAAEQFNKMAEKALQDGYEIVMTTAFRSHGFQKLLYENYIKNYGQEEADKFSAKPGTSEHQTGLAVDISCQSVSYQLTEEFENTEEWKWLSENAADFGFILRYPKDKRHITGYMYEPWHYRYVGIENAKTITSENITLEEYMNK